jgi:CheY-like chemotaxis protein
MKKKLLLADDSVTIQKVVQITFSHDDYDLTVVDNGDKAYEKARSQRPDLILADVFMPGKNGYELCAAIKNDPSLATVPVLLLTGTFEPFDEARARSAGADRWIAKPFESQTLIACVEELLSLAAQAPVMPPPAPAPVEDVGFPAHDLSSDLPDDIWGSEFTAEGGSDSNELPGGDVFAAMNQDDLWDVSGFETETPETRAATDDLWGSFETPPSVATTPAFAAVEADSWGSDDFASAFAASDTKVVDPFGMGTADVPYDDDVEILEEIDLFEPVADSSSVLLSPDSFPSDNLSFADEMVEPEKVEAPSVKVAPDPAAMLSEAQLDLIVERVAAVVVSRLAGTLLEKIAWEVVPDLAETMIKEELRQIREAVAAD